MYIFVFSDRVTDLKVTLADCNLHKTSVVTTVLCLKNILNIGEKRIGKAKHLNNIWACT